MYHEPHIFVNDEPLKATDYFTYMGSTLSREANIDVEVNNRLSKANSAFGRLRKKVWDRRGISQETKLKVYMAVVLIYTTIGDACVCVCAQFDQFLPVRSHFDTKRPVNFFHIATFPSPTFGPLFAFHCPLFFTKNNNLHAAMF